MAAKQSKRSSAADKKSANKADKSPSKANKATEQERSLSLDRRYARLLVGGGMGPSPDGSVELFDELRLYLKRGQIAKIKRAYKFGQVAHEGQTRQSGQPYISHPIAVARLLADLRMDHDTLCAAILHDTIEDTDIVKGEIAEQFGEPVAELVDGVSKLSRDFESRTAAQAENFAKMLMAMAQDIRVIIIKLADRLHNMRTLGVLKPDKRARIARETLEIHAPIANRLGMNSMRTQLEDLAFINLHPWRYNIIANSVNRARQTRLLRIEQVEEEVRKALQDQGVKATVISRQKHLYGIYQKIESKIHEDRAAGNVRSRDDYLKQIRDIYGIRIIVQDVGQCYQALGAVHNLYRPVIGRFKDYIAIPKGNGYQSLHTGLHDISGVPFEVQIRTEAMHQLAEAGIAAHWLYKASGDTSSAQQARANEWLSNLMELQGTEHDSVEFYEQVKIDLFPYEVYVYSPKGDIYRLPRGATPVDFAYAVHTDVGNHCFGARVDGRRVLMRTPLQSGQAVEILLDENAHPDPAWLSSVVTAKARSNVRHYLRQLKQDDAIRIGRTLLERALAGYDLKMTQFEALDISEPLKAWKLSDLNELYEAIGMGRRLAPVVARRVLHSDDEKPRSPSRLRRLLGGNASTSQPLVVRGTEGMVVNFAGCCHPIPGDPIVGFLSAGRGVIIHHAECRNTRDYEKHPDKWISCDWDDAIERDFPVRVNVEVDNRRGVLANVASAISAAGSDIDHLEIEDRDAHGAALQFTVRVNGRRHLAAVMRHVRRMPEVEKIFRV